MAPPTRRTRRVAQAHHADGDSTSGDDTTQNDRRTASHHARPDPNPKRAATFSDSERPDPPTKKQKGRNIDHVPAAASPLIRHKKSLKLMLRPSRKPIQNTKFLTLPLDIVLLRERQVGAGAGAEIGQRVQDCQQEGEGSPSGGPGTVESRDPGGCDAVLSLPGLELIVRQWSDWQKQLQACLSLDECVSVRNVSLARAGVMVWEDQFRPFVPQLLHWQWHDGQGGGRMRLKGQSTGGTGVGDEVM